MMTYLDPDTLEITSSSYALQITVLNTTHLTAVAPNYLPAGSYKMRVFNENYGFSIVTNS